MAHIGDLRPENFPRSFEGGRIGALETEDRLLAVAHHKQRAVRNLAAAGSGKELLRQRADDLPLGQAGILRFVDKDMLDAAVKLEQNPLRRCLIDKQVTGFQNEIVEVIGAAEFFADSNPEIIASASVSSGTRRLDAREIVDLLDQIQAARHLPVKASPLIHGIVFQKFFRNNRSNFFRLLAIGRIINAPDKAFSLASVIFRSRRAAKFCAVFWLVQLDAESEPGFGQFAQAPVCQNSEVRSLRDSMFCLRINAQFCLELPGRYFQWSHSVRQRIFQNLAL